MFQDSETESDESNKKSEDTELGSQCSTTADGLQARGWCICDSHWDLERIKIAPVEGHHFVSPFSPFLWLSHDEALFQFNSVQTRCTIKGEAQKSPLLAIFWGALISQERLFSRNSTRKLFCAKSPFFTNTPSKPTCLYSAPSLHIVDQYDDTVSFGIGWHTVSDSLSWSRWLQYHTEGLAITPRTEGSTRAQQLGSRHSATLSNAQCMIFVHEKASRDT